MIVASCFTRAATIIANEKTIIAALQTAENSSKTEEPPFRLLLKGNAVISIITGRGIEKNRITFIKTTCTFMSYVITTSNGLNFIVIVKHIQIIKKHRVAIADAGIL
jgi:hypothetical protein